MKQTKQFLRPLLMAIVMMAMSPMRAWAQEADPRMAVFNKLEGVTATFEDEGDYPWGLTRYIGLDALMSTNQGKDGTTSKTTIKLACDQAIDLQFSYETSSEAACDYLIISVDGNEVVNSYDAAYDEDGITNVYDTYVSPLPANENGHTITMSYIKDNSLSSGDDCGYIYSISAYTHQHYYNATSCDWKENDTAATLHLSCTCGLTADVEATTITTTEEAPTCEKDGFCTITASAAYNGKTVTYSKTETFAALGHDWQVQSDGTYACQREGCTALSIEIIESSGGFEGEGPENLFDGDPTTKWCGSDVENGSNSFYVKFKPGKPSVLVSYSLVDAEDTEAFYNRGWSSWDIQGTNDPNLEAWESISYKYGEDYQGRTFTTGNTTAYTYYMITFSVYDSEDGYEENYLQQMADMNITWCTEHQWGEDHKCSICGYVCQHSWDDGVCELCDYECKHKDLDEDDNCDICGIHAQTFDSLAALIAAGQDYDAVNVTIDDEILIALPHPGSDFSGMYAVILKSDVQLVAPIPEPALNWKSGGRIKGTVKYADWGEIDNLLTSKDADFWLGLEYTAPAPVDLIAYNSIDELLAANLENGTPVTVTINGTIAETFYEDEMYQIVLDNGFALGALAVATDPGWVVGGTISGTLENVIFIKNGEAEEVVVAIMSMDRNIFAELNYIVPAVTIGETEIEIALNSDGKYVAKENIVLTDGASFTANVEFIAPSITYTRVMGSSTSKWGTIMLPFEVSSDEKVQYYDVSEVNLTGGVMTATPVETVAAGHPCLFKRLDGGDLTAGSSEEILISKNTTNGNISSSWKLVGTYTAKVLNAGDGDYYYISADKFWHATGTVNVKPYRAYFIGEAPASAAKAMTIVVEDGEETRIEAVMDSEGNIHDASSIYDMQGRKLNSLQKGINIVNGKKVVVK